MRAGWKLWKQKMFSRNVLNNQTNEAPDWSFQWARSWWHHPAGVECDWSAPQRPRMWLMWPGSPPRHLGQQSGGGLGRTTSICWSRCWLDTVKVWDVSIGHSATCSPTPKHTRFALQLHGSTSASKLLFFTTLTHCMLTANRANS